MAQRRVEAVHHHQPQQHASADDERSNSDWGLQPQKPGLTRESKFIVGILLILVGVFGFVIFQRVYKKPLLNVNGDEVVDTEKTDAEAASGDTPVVTNVKKNAVLASTASAGSGFEDAGSGAEAVDPFGTAQSEPTADFAGQAEPGMDGFAATDPAGNQFETQSGNVGFDPVGGGVAANDAGFETQGEPNVEGFAETEVTATDAVAGFDPAQEELATMGVPAELPEMAETGTFASEAVPTGEFGQFEQGETIQTQATRTTVAQAEVPPGFDPVMDATTVPRTATRGTGTRTNPLASTPGTAPRGTTPRGVTPRGNTVPRVATNPRGVPGQSFSSEDKYGGFRPENPSTLGRHADQRQPFDVSSGFGTTNPASAEYILQPHDNFWRISRKAYGSARYFKALQKHNEAVAPVPVQMKPGQKISTPPREFLEQTYPSLIPAQARHVATAPVGIAVQKNQPAGIFVDQTTNQLFYRVGSSDSLSSISQKTLGRSSRWDEIYELNRDRLPSADELSVGTVLRLPADAVQSRLVGSPPTVR